MHAKLLSLSLITGLMSATAFAEPAIQAGDSLDSLSKVKVSTTVNGQAGSIQDLVASGQIRIVDANQALAAPNHVGTEAAIPNHSKAVNATTAQMASPAVEQANAPAIEQTAQVASENVEAIQPNAELAAQQTEPALNQKAATPMISSSADTPVNAADRSQIDVTQEAVAAAPVNAADTMMTNEAVAAAPEVVQPHDAVQAAPQADLSDAPINASPEAPHPLQKQQRTDHPVLSFILQ